MRRQASCLHRAFAVLLTVCLVVGALAVMPATVRAETPQKTQHTYDIAVAFDNSGSMYLDGNMAWARAKYAMEIFASMLDYEGGDKLTVFPMWEVQTDGSTPASTQREKKSKQPVEIRSKEDIDKLSRMYTADPYGTPFTPVEDAAKYLKKSTATDKWLIVLTDGDFSGLDESGLRKALLAKATGGVKVQYLRFAGGSSVKSDEKKGFYADSCDDATLINKLVDICNAIFQRAILPASSLQGKTLTLDLSMNNLIVFVQGQGAKISSLTDASGKGISATMNSGQRKYSDVKYGNGLYPSVTDTTLYGQVVTYSACPKGTYTLDYTGSKEAVQIFYEPNVDIRVELRNSDGQVVDPSKGEVEAGKYTVNSIIVDGVTGEDVTKHPLMGDDVKLVTKVKGSGDSDYTTYDNGATITLQPDKATEIVVEGTYLKDFTITTKDDPDAIPLPLWITEQKPDLKVEAVTEQDEGWYNLRKSDEWQPVRVSLTLDGQPLTDDQLAQTKIEFGTDKELPIRTEPILGESAYYVYIGQGEDGKLADPEKGRYTLTATADFVYEEGRSVTAQDKVRLDIQPYAKIWQTLFWILLFIFGVALFLLWYTHKVFPKRITLHKQSTKNKGFLPTGEKQRVGKSFTLRDGGNILFSSKAHKSTPWFKRKKSTATIKLTIGNLGAGVSNLKVGATKITKDDPEVTVSDGDVVKFTNSAGVEKKYQIRINAANKLGK